MNRLLFEYQPENDDVLNDVYDDYFYNTYDDGDDVIYKQLNN